MRFTLKIKNGFHPSLRNGIKAGEKESIDFVPKLVSINYSLLSEEEKVAKVNKKKLLATLSSTCLTKKKLKMTKKRFKMSKRRSKMNQDLKQAQTS